MKARMAGSGDDSRVSTYVSISAPACAALATAPCLVGFQPKIVLLMLAPTPVMNNGRVIWRVH